MAQAEARSQHQGQTSVNQTDCLNFVALNKEVRQKKWSGEGGSKEEVPKIKLIDKMSARLHFVRFGLSSHPFLHAFGL